MIDEQARLVFAAGQEAAAHVQFFAVLFDDDRKRRFGFMRKRGFEEHATQRDIHGARGDELAIEVEHDFETLILTGRAALLG